MTLRTRFVVYLTAVHVLLAGLAVYLIRQAPFALFAVEAAFIVSLIAGLRLTRRALRSVGFAAEAARQLRGEELTTRFRDVGDPDVDAIISVYNTMVDRLREERVRVQEQHAFLSQVLDASPSGIVVLSLEGLVATLNPAAERLLQVSRAEALDRAPGDLATPVADCLGVLGPGETRTVSLAGPRRIRCHHGTFIDRGFRRSFLLLEELTEEARAFERAAYEKLIRVMSHEVNNSVAAANSLLHSALAYGRELSPDSRVDFESALGIVIGRTEQLNLFMRRFADVFRLPTPQLHVCHLVPLVRHLVTLTASKPEAASVTWAWDVADERAEVMVDRNQFEQACLNVLTNAVEAAGPGGRVMVRIGRRHGRPVLDIEDSGPGLGPEAQENVFTPFFSTKPHGQGIGLTLVQEILSAHGLDYSLESPPGGSTRFRIVFPAARADRDERHSA